MFKMSSIGVVVSEHLATLKLCGNAFVPQKHTHQCLFCSRLHKFIMLYKCFCINTSVVTLLHSENSHDIFMCRTCRMHVWNTHHFYGIWLPVMYSHYQTCKPAFIILSVGCTAWRRLFICGIDSILNASLLLYIILFVPVFVYDPVLL